MSILVIESSETQRKILKYFLKTGGYSDVIVVDSTRKAIVHLKKAPHYHSSKVDLILMDTTLPGMSGIEMCRQIKATEYLKDVPIIMLAGKTGQDKLKLAFAVGALDYITKPVQRVELIARVGSLLQLKKEIDERKARERDILESIRYAKMIQSSLFPNPEQTTKLLPNSFFIWIPRDIISGDIYFVDFFKDGFIVAVIDCTGHGVPGGFMTMIASSGLRRIIHGEGGRNPSDILKRLNLIVKTTLQQDTDFALSDDGLDAAVCLVRPRHKSLVYAGARLPLYLVHQGKLKVIKADKQSLGYKRSDLKYNFKSHNIRIEEGMCFYMATDGYTDQLGGSRKRRFGTRRLKKLLLKTTSMSFPRQKKLFLDAFNKYKGGGARQDDVTIVGFGV
ncbi:response regulator [Desulfobacterales bacterium HSG16]|nr:response regulator [Desulfobacterales bacterium HSG16]